MLASCQYVKVPYFERIPVSQVCGGVTSHCQPNNSKLWQQVPSIDYSRTPSHWLGRSFTSVFERLPCGIAPTEADVDRYGKSDIRGTAEVIDKPQLVVKLGGNVREFIENSFGTALPEALKVRLAAGLTGRIDSAVNQTIELDYERVVLSQNFVDESLSVCRASVPATTNVITGISTLRVTGNWRSRRLSEAAADFELTAEYNDLSASAKAEYIRRRDIALSGTFDPVNVVFAVTYVRGAKPVESTGPTGL